MDNKLRAGNKSNLEGKLARPSFEFSALRERYHLVSPDEAISILRTMASTRGHITEAIDFLTEVGSETEISEEITDLRQHARDFLMRYISPAITQNTYALKKNAEKYVAFFGKCALHSMTVIAEQDLLKHRTLLEQYWNICMKSEESYKYLIKALVDSEHHKFLAKWRITAAIPFLYNQLITRKKTEKPARQLRGLITGLPQYIDPSAWAVNSWLANAIKQDLVEITLASGQMLDDTDVVPESWRVGATTLLSLFAVYAKNYLTHLDESASE